MASAKPFGDWTLAQQQALWQSLASEALSVWGLRAREVSWLGYSNNAVFKVATAGGDFVLRLHAPGPVTSARLRSELAWLRHIRQQSDLLAPFPLPVADTAMEDSLVALAHPQLPPPHQVIACLFAYMPGDGKAAQALTQDDVCAVGRYLAQLHTGGQFQPPGDFDRPRLDADGFFADDSPYASSREGDALTAPQLAVCREVAQAVEAAMTRLAQLPGSFGLIHGDLLAKNVLFSADGVAALDFEHCAWGYFVYDLAPLLWQLKGERPQDYAHLKAALWAGYASLRPQAKREREYLETLIVARQLASCRWLLQNQHHPQVRAAAPTLLAGRIDQLRAFLATGSLLRHTATL